MKNLYLFCLFIKYLHLLLNIVIRNIVNIITICIKCVRVCVCTYESLNKYLSYDRYVILERKQLNFFQYFIGLKAS